MTVFIIQQGERYEGGRAWPVAYIQQRDAIAAVDEYLTEMRKNEVGTDYDPGDWNTSEYRGSISWTRGIDWISLIEFPVK